MSLFQNRSRGSITVLVSLILIPTVFFTGFMTDLARVKLYGSQAVMAADNYGEAVLSYYDNVLKELYGLFAVTQNEEGLKAIEDLNTYMETSFNPTSSAISWSHLGGIFSSDEYSGFMPYSSASLEFTYEAADNANLGNNEVLSTQIGDFMKFRIAQVLLDGDDDGDGVVDKITDAISDVQNTEKNAEAIELRNELNDLASEAFELAQDYYEVLEQITEYPDYLSDVNAAYSSAKTSITNAVNSTSYKTYKNYVQNETAILRAVNKQKEIEKAQSDEDSTEEPEILTEQEKKYIAMYEAYQADSNARKSYFQTVFNNAITSYKDSLDCEPIDFDNFSSLAGSLERIASNLKDEIDAISKKRDELESVLSDSSVSDSIRDGIKDELSLLDALFEVNGSYSGTNYENLASYVASNTSVNSTLQTQAETIRAGMVTITNEYLSLSSSISSWPSALDTSQYKDFMDVSSYKALYEALEGCFGEGASDDAEETAKQKKSEAETELSKAENSLSESESTDARDIPSSFGFGTNGSGNDFALSKLINTAASYFSANSFAEAGNELLLKLYTVEYDFGMFSSRVTNLSSEEDSSEKAESLTGYEMCREINYLYQAEIEYLFGGYNSSEENLNSARNKILAFRAVMNFAATYSVDSVDTAIRRIADAASLVNPLLGFAVSGALRLAVAGIETAADWELLKSGESVTLLKNQMCELTGLGTIISLLGMEEDEEEENKDGVSLDYEEYLMVMLLFMTTSDELIERTGNLVCLNVNAVEQNIGESGTLSKLEFTMDGAVTAVNASCKIHLDFVVMPNGFAQSVADSDTYTALEEFEKNYYKFTVTRGY